MRPAWRRRETMLPSDRLIPIKCILLIWTLIQLIENVESVAIDNDVQGDPVIECGDMSLTFSVKTKKLFAGRIFVKGKTGDTSCMRADFAKQQTASPVFDLEFGSCGMKGQRADEPRGMFYSVNIVVSFHPMFVTKVDRAYHVKCFFEETLRTLTAGIDVSMISTVEATAFRTSVGTCTYTIHQGTAASGPSGIGPPVSVAQVGDKIVHKWECTDAMYGILVKSCVVTDGFGMQAEVIDNRGCPVDPILISAISYDSSLTQAYAESHVFKFADRPGVWFYCQLQMCLKMSQACEGLTPPNCGMMTPAAPGGGGSDETLAAYNRSSRPPSYGRSSGNNLVPPTGVPTGVEEPLLHSLVPPTGVPTGVAIPVSDFTEPSDAAESIDSVAASIGSAPMSSRLPPAPAWTTSTGGSSPTPATPRETYLITTPPSVLSYSPKEISEKRKLLIHQRIEDERVSTIGLSTSPAIYEEEELIYDESGPESETSQAAAAGAKTTAGSPGSDEAIVVTGIRHWRRPSPTAGSLEKSIAYRAHRRTTAAMRRKALRKRAAATTAVPSNHQEADDYDVRTTRRYQEIEKKLRRPATASHKQRTQQQQHQRFAQQQSPKPQAISTDPEADGMPETFIYKDSELSNRLIIFDVDEEPPPDYMHWSHNAKDGSKTDRDRPEAPDDKEQPARIGGGRLLPKQSPATTATAVSDACIVSAQGLIMILTASGSLSALLIIVLIAVCVRYRAARNQNGHHHKTYRGPSVLRASDSSEDSGIIVASRERPEKPPDRSDPLRSTENKIPRRQQPRQDDSSSSSFETIELPRLARAQERRKHR